MKKILPWLGFGACLCLVVLCFVVFGVLNNESTRQSVSPSQPPVQLNSANSNATPVAVPEPSAKAISYFHYIMIILPVIILWNILFPALFLFTGLSAKLRSWSEKVGRRRYINFCIYCIVFGLIYFLVTLPLSYYAGFIQPHHYDLSNQSFVRWLSNSAKSAAILLVTGLAVGWVPFLVIKKSPRRWWLYLGLLESLFMAAQVFVQPVLVDPLFHKFQPLADKALETKILAEAARAGIQSDRVFEVDMSLDTKAENAYVTGLFDTKRIVLWDTMLKTMNDDQVLFIMGHEMGHYVLNHMTMLILFDSVVILLSNYIAFLLAGPVINLFKKRWGFSVPWDLAALPLGIIAFWLFCVADMPVLMAFSRHIEHEADRFGLELTHNNYAAATAFVALQQANLNVPRPPLIFQLWLGSHPTVAERIEFCNDYRPWETGQPSKYEKYISP
jgi:Zn-dependent protease with chaperone function